MPRMLPIVLTLALAACGGSGSITSSPAQPTVASDPNAGSSPPVRPAEPMQMAAAPAEQEPALWDVPHDAPPPRPEPAPVARGGYGMLPEDFKVYVRGNTVINHPQRGFDERVLPTINDFRGAPGCYVACYSHDRERGVYGVGGNIYVMGQVRVPGRYEGRVCLPERYGHADISAAEGIKELCKASIPTCGHGCWGGGDTGGWYGVR